MTKEGFRRRPLKVLPAHVSVTTDTRDKALGIFSTRRSDSDEVQLSTTISNDISIEISGES